MMYVRTVRRVRAEVHLVFRIRAWPDDGRVLLLERGVESMEGQDVVAEAAARREFPGDGSHREPRMVGAVIVTGGGAALAGNCREPDRLPPRALIIDCLQLANVLAGQE